MANDPELILADEPTASLDAANGYAMMELLWRMTSKQGRTAIVVTHDSRIFQFADHVYWLENGRVADHQQPVVEQSEVNVRPLLTGANSFGVIAWPGVCPSLVETRSS
jgi:putative ABC transport system ATP-binding protein